MKKDDAITQYHRWLEGRLWLHDDERRFSLALESANMSLCDLLGEKIARHLSDVDSGQPGGWLYFGEELVSHVATKEGIEELANAFPSLADHGDLPRSEQRCTFLADVARLGGAVLYLPSICYALRRHPDLFVAGILQHNHPSDTHDEITGDLTVDHDRMGTDIAVRVITDSALEWAHSHPPKPSNVTTWKFSS